ncbi:MAG: pentapeptide repeat-containing protein [Calditrichia bacterium]|nr:pentapeptide repeat-containing protein [Calditrichia bacterium]
MVNEEHLKILKQSTDIWNNWRKKNPELRPNLSKANLVGLNFNGKNLTRVNFNEAKLTGSDLRGTSLIEADFRKAELSNSNFVGLYLTGVSFRYANLTNANFIDANFSMTDFRKANLKGVNFSMTDLSLIDLSGANLVNSNLNGVNLYMAKLNEANLSGANLMGALLVDTHFENANISGCKIYGVSTWDVHLNGSTQKDLNISPYKKPSITVDNLEVAQFIYLLLHNEKIRDVINTVANKAVLILGRFTPKRKAVLNAIREELRINDYLPIVFDFEKAPNRDFTEIILTLAGLSKFIIADISEPKSIPLELQVTIPNFNIPYIPIIQEGQKPFSMFNDLQTKYNWVLAPITYKDINELINNFKKGVLKRAEEKYQEIQIEKSKIIQTPISIRDIK